MKVLQDIRRLEIGNIPAFSRPKFTDTLKFPDDLTALTSVNVSELMGKYASMLAFVEQEATTWTIKEIEVERKLEDAKAKFLQEHPKKVFLDRWRLEASMKQEADFGQLHNRLAVIRGLKERALSMVRIYDRLINVLSRELSRRLATNDGARHFNGH